MTNREIRAKVERSSLGTPSARAARRSVSQNVAARIVASAQAQGSGWSRPDAVQGRFVQKKSAAKAPKSSRKSGG